jgi:hypothetical protein
VPTSVSHLLLFLGVRRLDLAGPGEVHDQRGRPGLVVVVARRELRGRCVRHGAAQVQVRDNLRASVSASVTVAL